MSAITRLTLDPLDNARLANLCGPLDENLRQIEQALDVAIAHRANRFDIRGARADDAGALLEAMYAKAAKTISVDDIQLAVVQVRQSASGDESPVLRTRRADLIGRTTMQRQYLRDILSHDITFGVGPAGPGKTYLAVACAVDALEREAVQRIVLTRPAVEAGERLGFLPGDLSQKIDPYLRPLYDALYDLLGYERVQKLHERNALEIAPLAYMRGRTLNHAFVILDEAQNTTPEQMKMFLTRIGFGSRAVVTGDVTQVDLQRGQRSGLADALEVLQGLRGLAFTRFSSADVVRHPLVGRIVDAYELAGNERARESAGERPRGTGQSRS
ncbi:PhoH family protein [soil metagenome]